MTSNIEQWLKRLPLILVGVLIASPALADYQIPFKGEDLDAGEYLFTRDHAAGIQVEGRDISSVKKDRSGNWKFNKGSKNEDSYIYGQPFYAVAAGEIVACWRNAPDNPAPGKTHPKKEEGLIAGGGNHIWVEQDDGVVTLYAHASPGSIPKKLCPFKDEYLPQKAGFIGKHPDILPFLEIEKSKRPRVSAGQLLGKVGNSGASSAPHLHIHFEKGGKAKAPRFERGLYAAYEGGKATGDSWSSFARKDFPNGEILMWPARSLTSEYSRHGLKRSDYGPLFKHLAESGFAPEWIDGYDVKGTPYLNMVWRPANGASWTSYSAMSGSTYQKKYDENKRAGRYLVHLDSYLDKDRLRYVATFSNRVSEPAAYHGLSSSDHQKQFDKLTKSGYQPVNVTVVSVKGKKKYAAFYRKESGAFTLRSTLSSSQYQDEYTKNEKAGRRLAFLNSYVHKGKPYYVAIFRSSVPNKSNMARHGVTGSQYQSNFSSAMRQGMLTRGVTAYSTGKDTRWAAFWRKP